MKKTIFIFALLLLAKNFFGQSILLSFVGDDCSKCQMILTAFLQKINKEVPVFLIFPEEYRADSIGLTHVFPNIEGNYVFNDHYYNLIDPKSSSIAYLNGNGEVSFKKSLVHLVSSDQRIFDSLYKAEAKRIIHHPVMSKFVDGWKISENPITKSITVDSGDQSYKYTVDSITIYECVRAIDKIMPNFYAKTEDARRINEVPETFLKPRARGHAFSKGTFYYILTLPYVAPPNYQDSLRGLKGHISNFNVMVRIRNNIHADYFPIVSTRHIPGEKENYLLKTSSFFVLDDSSFVFFQYCSGKQHDSMDHKYVSVFKLQNNTLTFNRRLNNKFPEIYFSTGVGFILAPSFNAFDYPYYTPSLGTQISDLSTGKDYQYVPLYKIDYSTMDSIAFVHRLVEGKDKLPVSNRYLFKRNANNIICLISRLDTDYYINVFKSTIDSLKFISTIYLNKKIQSIAENAWFEYDRNNDIIRIEDKDGVLRSFPLELLIGKN